MEVEHLKYGVYNWEMKILFPNIFSLNFSCHMWLVTPELDINQWKLHVTLVECFDTCL